MIHILSTEETSLFLTFSRNDLWVGVRWWWSAFTATDLRTLYRFFHFQIRFLPCIALSFTKVITP